MQILFKYTQMKSICNTKLEATPVILLSILILKFVLFLVENKNKHRHSGAGRNPVFPRSVALKENSSSISAPLQTAGPVCTIFFALS